MTEVLLYHHVQGLTEGVRAFADELRQAGHAVHTPDLFDGRTFDTIDDGTAFARDTGFAALAERGLAAAEVTTVARFATFAVTDGVEVSLNLDVHRLTNIALSSLWTTTTGGRPCNASYWQS